jgi:hypothetical protein
MPSSRTSTTSDKIQLLTLSRCIGFSPTHSICPDRSAIPLSFARKTHLGIQTPEKTARTIWTWSHPPRFATVHAFRRPTARERACQSCRLPAWNRSHCCRRLGKARIATLIPRLPGGKAAGVSVIFQDSGDIGEMLGWRRGLMGNPRWVA